MFDVIVEMILEGWWLLDVMNVTTPYIWLNCILDDSNHLNTVFWICIFIALLVHYAIEGEKYTD